MDGRRQKANAWSRIFIGAAIEVHRLKGPGLLEPIYRKCVRRECELRDIPTQYELIVPIEYKETTFEEPLRLDVLGTLLFCEIPFSLSGNKVGGKVFSDSGPDFR